MCIRYSEILEKNDEVYEVLKIDMNTIDGASKKWTTIWSDKIGANISENGFHVGVLYNGKVYDNISKSGVPIDEWLADFTIPYENGSANLWKLYMDGLLKFE